MLAPGGGLHGTAAPDAVLASLRPILPRAGITRVAVLTGLDTLGVPVAAAMRPNSRSLAVHQGKGATTAVAKLAAVMEAMECYCAESLDAMLRLASAAELRREAALDVTRLPQRSGGANPLTARLLWVEGEDLLAGGQVWVPRETVAADWALPLPPGEALFQATSNGLGAGLDIAAATAHALYEVIERDAVAVWRARPAAARRATALDPASVNGPASRALLDHLAYRGTEIAIWDTTSDLGVPSFMVWLGDRSGRHQPELGSGCHALPDAALFRALTEAAQSRLTIVSGARDDFTDVDYAPAVRAGFERSAVPSRGFAACRPGPAGDVATLLDALGRAGVTQVARVDLSRPEAFPVRVVRVVVPGLEGPHTGPHGEYLSGPRARAAAAS